MFTRGPEGLPAFILKKTKIGDPLAEPWDGSSDKLEKWWDGKNPVRYQQKHTMTTMINDLLKQVFDFFLLR